MCGTSTVSIACFDVVPDVAVMIALVNPLRSGTEIAKVALIELAGTSTVSGMITASEETPRVTVTELGTNAAIVTVPVALPALPATARDVTVRDDSCGAVVSVSFAVCATLEITALIVT